MKFDTPATTNPIDQLKVVGKPLDRIDGPLKTTGTAPMPTSGTTSSPMPAYGYVVGSAHREGPHRVHGSRRGQGGAGVLAIVTAENAGKLDKGELNTAQAARRARRSSITTRPIALVVAETFEQARAAAQLVRVDYVTSRGRVRSRGGEGLRARAEPERLGGPPETAVGDFDGAFAAAPVKLDADLHDARPSRTR